MHARGLCTTHYQRARRTGDPAKTRRAGRPKSDDPKWLAVRAQGLDHEWSLRTVKRYIRAWQIIDDLGEPGAFEAVLTAATRPNGTVNMAQIERAADVTIARWVVTNMPKETES